MLTATKYLALATVFYHFGINGEHVDPDKIENFLNAAIEIIPGATWEQFEKTPISEIYRKARQHAEPLRQQFEAEVTALRSIWMVP